MQNNQKIPEGWSVKKLRECLEIKHGKPQHDIENPQGMYPILASGGQIGRTNSFLCSEPSVLIGRKGTIDKPQYMETPFWTVDTLFYSHIKSGYMAKYLFYKFETINWNKYNEGSTIPSLSSSTIHSIKVLLPPLPEQKKIAGILGTWDKAIEKLISLIEQKKLLKKGLMQKLLTGKHRLKGFSTQWDERYLVDLCDFNKGQQLNKANMLVNGRYPVLNGGISYSGYTNDWNTKANTITISEGGNSCGFVSFIKEKFWCGGHCYTVFDIKTDIMFLYHLLKYNENNIMNLRVGSGLPNIQISSLYRFKVLVPSNFAEQKAIAEILSKADEEIELLNKKLEAFKLEKKALMQQLLTGKIRVKVN